MALLPSYRGSAADYSGGSYLLRRTHEFILHQGLLFLVFWVVNQAFGRHLEHLRLSKSKGATYRRGRGVIARPKPALGGGEEQFVGVAKVNAWLNGSLRRVRWLKKGVKQ